MNPSITSDSTKFDDLEIIAVEMASLWRNPRENRGQAVELQRLLNTTNSRAAGVWRLVDQRLRLVGFLAVHEMALNIQQEFISITNDVGLSQIQLGIVQAVISGGPAINHRPTQRTMVHEGSIGWLERFEAASSLAIPLLINREVAGAIAVATNHRIQPDDSTYQLLSSIAERLTAQKSAI